jgi:hypothetical protein
MRLLVGGWVDGWGWGGVRTASLDSQLRYSSALAPLDAVAGTRVLDVCPQPAYPIVVLLARHGTKTTANALHLTEHTLQRLDQHTIIGNHLLPAAHWPLVILRSPRSADRCAGLRRLLCLDGQLQT